uniref:Uncharacterized protein n=1 Tax=Panagrolaimus sp. ES5 TaxID=591445 RepID=A0AC34GP16_9BILA
MDGTLYFSYNKKEDATSYACSLSLPSIQSGHYGPFFNLIFPQSVPGASSSPKIDEFQPQIFPEIPTRGQSIFIECFAYGFPAPKYKWSRVDGEPLSARHRILNYGRVLKIDSVTVDDAARYKCVAFNEFGRESAEIQLLVHSPPTLLKPLINQRIATNTSANFECIAASQYSNQVTIEWFHNGQPISPLLMPAAERKRFKINENVLNILNAAENDSGIFQCIVSNDVGSVSSSARLTVEDAAPKFHGNIFPRRIFVVEGSKLSLPCLYLASPRGFAHWYSASSSDAIPVDPHSRMRQKKELIGNEESISVLEIDNIEKTDEGIFHCETANGVGEGKGVVQVKVVPKPQIVVRPPSLASGMASNSVYQTPTKITCEVELACELPDDCPEALFDWQFNDQSLKHVVTRGLPLKMNAKEKEVEKYWGENNDEDTRSSRWLFETPTNKKSKEDKRKKVKHVRQLSQVEVSPEFSSANIGRFSCTSIYGSGSSEVTEPKTLSSAPTQLKIIEVNRNYVKLSWKQPANQKRRGFGTNVRMEGYQIEYRTASNRQWRPFPNGLFKTEDRIIGSYLLKNLESNEKYQFRVRSRAADGSMSAPSLHTEWIETPQSPPLDPIQRLQWRTIDDSHLLLEWDPVESSHQSGPNLRYNVSWSDPAPSIPALAKFQADTFAHSEMVSEPNIVIPIKVFKPKKKKIKKNKNRVEDVTESCFTIAVGVQPLNDVGAGPTSTDTVVQISTEGPKRYADNLLAIPVNSTHLNLTWEWKNTGGCENIIGAYIQCLETSAFINDVSSFSVNHSSEDETITVKKVPPLTRDMDSLIINQSVPAHYTSWLVHGLKPGTEYSCTVRAFDQYGRYGNTSKHATSARTLDPAPPFPPEITMIKLQEMDDSLTTLIEWTAIPLRNSLYDNVTDHQRGYKILIYVSETAERPIVLTLTEAELQNPRKPSARIDGLKLMYYYTIKVAGFNEGGIGPVSKPTSIRLGVSSDFNASNSSFFSLLNIFILIIVMCLMHFNALKFL